MAFLRDHRATTDLTQSQWRHSTKCRACRLEHSTAAGRGSSTLASFTQCSKWRRCGLHEQLDNFWICKPPQPCIGCKNQDSAVTALGTLTDPLSPRWGNPSERQKVDGSRPEDQNLGGKLIYQGPPGAYEVLVSWQPELLGKTQHGPRQHRKEGLTCHFFYFPTSRPFFCSSIPRSHNSPHSTILPQLRSKHSSASLNLLQIFSKSSRLQAGYHIAA